MSRPSGPGTLLATTHRGLEPVLAQELEQLGAQHLACGRGAVEFQGDLETLYRALLHLRCAVRVLRQLGSGPVRLRDELYRLAGSIAWEELVLPPQTMAVEAVGRNPGFDSNAFAALVVKDAVVDRLRARTGKRPDVDRAAPDVAIHVHLSPTAASLALDAAGEPLSHRGYRPRGGPAPLSEALAAGLLLLAGYDGATPLVDPLCGTGTFAIEAGLIATRTPPGLGRTFACERWAGADPSLMARLRTDGRDRRRPAPGSITASDQDGRAVQATERNAGAAGVGDAIGCVRRPLEQLPDLAPGSMIVTNPPWGRRMGEIEALRPLYRRLGDLLKQRAAGSCAWLLLGEPELAREIGLRPARRHPVFNGPVECRWVRYDLLRGSFPR